MKTRIEKSLAAFSMTVAMSSAAFAANVSTDGYVYLNADDPGGNYSFNSVGRWYENGAPASSAPTSGKNYLVQSTSGSMRVLRVDGSRIFQGSSLTLDNGEIRASGGNPFTVGSLIVYKGMMSAANASTQLKMAGGIAMQNGGELQFGGGWRRSFECSANIVGDSTTKLVVNASGYDTTATAVTVPYWLVCLSGDNSAFTGSIAVKTYAWEDKQIYLPSALVAGSDNSLGNASAMTFASRTALLGKGAAISDARSITVGGLFSIGAYTAGNAGYGLKLDGGMTIAGTGDSVLYVTNCVSSAVTVLGNVVLSGFSKIVVQSGTLKFASGYNNALLPVEVCPGASIASEAGAVVGALASTDGSAPISVALPAVDTAALNRSNAGFSYPLLSSSTLSTDQFHLYGRVTREQFVIEDNVAGVPTLYWKRETDNAHDVYWAYGTDSGSGYIVDAYWTNDGSTKVRAGSANDYIIEDGKMVRQRSTSQSNFAGHMLSILGGGDLSIHDGTKANTADLQLFENGIIKLRGSPAAGTFGGTMTVRTSANGYAKVEAEAGTLNLNSSLIGDGNVRYQTSASGTIYVKGDNRAFIGKVQIPHSTLTVKFAGENAVGGNPARFAANGLEVADGVTLWCDATYPFSVTSQNRGVKVLGVANVDVADGQTCEMTTAISGAGSIVKKNAGTLRLGNDDSSFAGGVALNAGVIEAVSTNAFGVSSLTYVGGTLKVSCNGPLVIRGVTPIATSSPVPVAVSPDGADWDGAKTPLFLFPDSTEITDATIGSYIVPTGHRAYATKYIVESTVAGILVSAKADRGLSIFIR